MLDFNRPSLSGDEGTVADLVDYTACEALADGARGAELELLRS